MPSTSVDSSEILKRMRDFTTHQSTRVALYKEFEESFDENHQGKLSDAEFALICKITTDGFNEVSHDIRSVESDMKGSLNRPDLAGLIRDVQELEREKLKLTVNTQIYMKQQLTSEQDFDTLIRDTRHSLTKILEQINEKMRDIHEIMAEL